MRSTVAQQPRHAHIKGIVILDIHLAAQRVPHWRLNFLSELKDFLAGITCTSADEEGDFLRLINSLRQCRCFCGIWESNGVPCGNNRLRELVIFRLKGSHITGDHEYRYTIASHRGLNSVVRNDSTLGCGVNHLAVAGGFFEQDLRVRLLEELSTDLA